jgi:hydroxymethylglutaryl-CoA synthase
MQLFGENADVEGIDTYNACYAGTQALFNSCAWVESAESNGRLALVVAADIAEYAQGNARATGGCGAVAFLVGPDAPLPLERGRLFSCAFKLAWIELSIGVRASHFEHAWDFFKPNLSSPYPGLPFGCLLMVWFLYARLCSVVDGHYSNVCYLRSLDQCFAKYCAKYKATVTPRNEEWPFMLNFRFMFEQHGKDFDLKQAAHVLFHAPYNKLVQKSYGRLVSFVCSSYDFYIILQVYNDFLRNPSRAEYQDKKLEAFGKLNKEQS